MASGDGVGAPSVGEVNKQLVLNAMRRRGAATVDELVRTTGRSQPTVLKWLGELERDGILRRGGRAASTGGRRPVLYELVAERGLFLGVALEVPDARLSLVDLRGHERAGDGWRLAADATPDDLLDDVAARARAFLAAHADGGGDVLAAGVVVSGFIDRDAGLWLATPRRPAWRHVPVRDVLAARLGVPVTLHHHIDAVALGETCCGAARGLDDFLFFDVGHGLGVRAVRNGEHLHGRFGNAGLIGHATAVPGGRPCLCGNHGCLEEYVSERALLRDWSRLAPRAATDDPTDLVAQRLFAEARASAGPERTAVEELQEFLSLGVATTINLFDVPHVVLAGFVRAGGEAFRTQLEAAVRARLQPTLARHTRVDFAVMPRTRAAGHGAALYALRHRFPAADPLVASGDEPREEVSAPPGPPCDASRDTRT